MSSQKMHGQIDARMAGLEKNSAVHYCIGSAVVHDGNVTAPTCQNLTQDNVIEDTNASRPIRQSVARMPRRSRPIPRNATTLDSCMTSLSLRPWPLKPAHDPT